MQKIKVLFNKYNSYSEDKKKIINTCFLLSLLVVSIVYLCIGIYQNETNQEAHCIWLSAIIMGIWFLIFPEAMDKKEKLLYHFVFLLFEIILYCAVLIYWIIHLASSNLLIDVAIIIILPFAITHTFYVLYKICYLFNQVFKGLSSDNKIIRFIKMVTAVIVVITAFFTEIIALTNAVQDFIGRYI